MQRILVYLTLLTSLTLVSSAQQRSQTAREALLDMLFGKPGSFEKHLPAATSTAFREVSGGDDSTLQQLSMITELMKTQGRLETFEAGPTLLTFADEKKHTRFEVVIKEDNLRGDEDEIVLAFAVYNDGRSQNLQFSPLLSLLMTSESGVWRLNQLSFTVRVPLGDPDFLKSIVESVKKRQALRASAAPMGTLSAHPTAWQSTPNEASAISSMRTILTAQMTYATQYPSVGFSCSLSDLDGFGQGTSNEHQAMLIESRLASGKKGGYVVSLSQCGMPPAKHFVLTGVPSVSGAGRTLCADESGLIRASDLTAESCLSIGKPLE
jgi:type IV pilus assembly protein PilA